MLGLIGSSANIPSMLLFVELKRPASVIVTVEPDVFVKVFCTETFDEPDDVVALSEVALVVPVALANPVAAVSVPSALSALEVPAVPVPKAITLNVPGDPEQFVTPPVGLNSDLFTQSAP